MRKVLDIVKVGSKIVMDGRVHTLTQQLGNGEWAWYDNQEPPAYGNFQFNDDTYENINLTVIE